MSTLIGQLYLALFSPNVNEWCQCAKTKQKALYNNQFINLNQGGWYNKLFLHLLIDFHNYAIERLDVRWKDDTKTKLAQFRYVVTWETIVEFIKPKRGSGEYGAGF